MSINYHIQKTRLKADRRHHNNLPQAIIDNPACLNIPGLVPENIIWRASDYHYMHGTRDKDKGQYEVCPGPDLVFLYEHNGIQLLVIEVKGSILGRSHVAAGMQLSRAENYFRGFWKALLVHDAKGALLKRLGNFTATGVYLSLAEVSRELLSNEYTVMPYQTGMYLGQASGLIDAYQVRFNEN